MAIVDADSSEIVLRILYDGPPLAGKTTSLRVLAEGLAASRTGELFSPAEAEGRTLYFDWLDYLGGWFEGHRVRCQIVSAPGQASLVGRRKLLLRDADVVVFVVDSTADGLEAAAEHYQRLRQLLDRPGEPHVPIEIQANKQDLPGAMALEQIQALFSKEPNLAVFPSCAEEGSGVMEAFAFAVRLAIDRAGVLLKEGKLRVGEPAVQSGEELLSWIETEEGVGAAERRTEKEVSRRAVAPDGASAAGGSPLLPDAGAPSANIWPAMAGRIVLRQLEAGPAKLWRKPNGAWLALAANQWWLYSAANHIFTNVEKGRTALDAATQHHEAIAGLLSENRAYALAEAGNGSWRLWQIGRREPSLADSLTVERARAEGGVGVHQIIGCANALIRMDELVRQTRAPFRAALRTLGADDPEHRYIGIVAETGGVSEADSESQGTSELLVRRELGGPLRILLGEQLIDLPQALADLRRLLEERPDRRQALEAIAAILIGH